MNESNGMMLKNRRKLRAPPISLSHQYCRFIFLLTGLPAPRKGFKARLQRADKVRARIALGEGPFFLTQSTNIKFRKSGIFAIENMSFKLASGPTATISSACLIA
jgi:hypothetical protein